MKGRSIPYSADELAFIHSVSGWPRHEAHAAFCQRFARDDVTLHNFNALCKRKGWKTGRTGCFQPGQAPVNKGRKCPPGHGGNHPNSRKTQFKKGYRNGVAARNYKPIGTERISKDGYIERKVGDDGPARRRWRSVHLIHWEAVHGPLPEGHALKCLDGDKANTDPSNWKAIPRAMLPRLNGRFGRDYDNAPAELKPTIMAATRLEYLVEQMETRKETQ